MQYCVRCWQLANVLILRTVGRKKAMCFMLLHVIMIYLDFNANASDIGWYVLPLFICNLITKLLTYLILELFYP